MALRFALSVLLLALAGCATDTPMNFACARMNEFRTPLPVTPGGSALAASDDRLVAAMREAFQARSVAAASRGSASGPSLLILSGGGQWGAYGAGLYKGWGVQTDPALARPLFDIVTGVSTGAMQATFAFLGKDQQLVDAYTIQAESELVTRHGSLFFLNHGSTADLSPLRARAAQLAGPLLDEVAQEGAKKRLLYVGSVDALTGEMYAINLTDMAQKLTGAERLDCYTGAILASAAIPVVFRQVTIDGAPYYDAGVRSSVFVAGMQRAAARALASEDPQPAGNVYILVNGVPGVSREDHIRAAILPTLDRLREITFDQIDQDSIYAAYVTASQLQKMNTYVATAAGHGCQADADDDALFDPAFMGCLIAAGEASWRQGSPWRAYPKP